MSRTRARHFSAIRKHHTGGFHSSISVSPRGVAKYA